MPPPSTSMRLGMKLSSSAAVESQMRGSAGMNPGAAGSEPAAMIALLKRTTPRALGRLDAQGFGRGEPALAGHHPHLALLRKHGQTACQTHDDAILPGANGGGIEGRRAEFDPVRAHRGGFVDGLGDMQQRLRGDAADVEANPAKRCARVDQHHVLPEIGGAEGGGIAARTGAVAPRRRSRSPNAPRPASAQGPPRAPQPPRVRAQAARRPAGLRAAQWGRRRRRWRAAPPR